jgi:DNA-binding NarL/FixJ family response regulator
MTPPPLITLLLADDHPIVRQGLCLLLGATGRFQIIGEAQNGREAVKLARSLRPDVILMDISMPLLNGLDAAAQILAVNPAAKIVMLSAHTDDEYIERARMAGAVGFLAKQTATEVLTATICAVANGEPFPTSPIAKRPAAPKSKPRAGKGRSASLTAQEAAVLRLVADGSANRQVAAALGISLKLVESHLRRLSEKLKIDETADLIRCAIRQGFVPSDVRLTIT